MNKCAVVTCELRLQCSSVCVKRFGDFHCTAVTAHHMPVLYILNCMYITGEVLTVDSDQAQADSRQTILYAMVVGHTVHEVEITTF